MMFRQADFYAGAIGCLLQMLKGLLKDGDKPESVVPADSGLPYLL
jgi:hypothetical protein